MDLERHENKSRKSGTIEFVPDPRLSVLQNMNQVRTLRKQGLQVIPRSARDENLALSLDLPPQILRDDQQMIRPILSVIIPTHPGNEFLKEVLEALSTQDLKAQDFETLVVLDGGSQMQALAINESLEGIASKLRLRVLHCPRKSSQEKEFRAAFCRNRGALACRGEQLLFLDSDILLPGDYLRGLLGELQHFQVIQSPRRHVLATDKIHGHSEDPVGWIEDPAYWGEFFKTTDWNQIPSGWLYTCSYTLALSKSLFLDVGGFRESFRHYGFEDTEFGYRLFQCGARHQLWAKTVFHRSPSRKASRYLQMIWLKHFLLMKSARHFVLSTLDEEVLYMFRRYLWFDQLKMKAHE